jgi:hypothetical protein
MARGPARRAHLRPTSPACLVPKLSGLPHRSASRFTDGDVVKLPFQTLGSGNSAVGMTVAVTVVQPRGIYEPAAIRWDFAHWDSDDADNLLCIRLQLCNVRLLTLRIQRLLTDFGYLAVGLGLSLIATEQDQGDDPTRVSSAFSLL